jgi:hypothetical protein
MFVPSGESSVTFAETAAAGTLISVLNCDYPNNCSEAVYAADKTTAKTLDTRTVTAKDAAYDNFLYPLRPADWVGFNRSNFTIYVSPWTSMTSANILVEVTLMNNSVVNRNISITGAGTYFILNRGEMARASTRSKVTTHVGLAGKTFTYKVNQSRWGVVWKTGANAFTFKYSGFQIGEAAKSVNISFLNKVSSFDYNGTNGAFNRNVFTVSGARSSLNFTNCSTFIDDTDCDLGGKSKRVVSSSDMAFFNVSKSNFKTIYPNRFYLSSSTKANFADVICDGQTIYNGNVSLSNVLFTNFQEYLYNVFCRYTNDVTFNGGTYGIVIALGNVLNVSNSRFTGSTSLFGAVLPTKDNFLVNCESDVWTFGGGSYAVGGKMHRQYTFDLRVQNATSKENLSGATCRLYNNTGVLVSTLVTGVNGCTTRKILDNTWWNSSTSVDGNVVSPYTLNLTKAGYQSMEVLFVLDHAVNFTLGMKGNISGGCGSTALNVIEDLKNCTGTSESAYDPADGWTVWNNYTGYNALNFIEWLINCAGTHEMHWTGIQWDIWNNYTGNTTGIILHETAINATGTHTSTLRDNNTYDVYANYTGDTTPIHVNEDIGNATGSHDYLQNSTGYWVWANYTSTLLSRETLNAYLTGTHEYRWNASTGKWMTWANYSGADLLSRENVVNATGTHESRYNASSNHWMSWANYTGNTTLLNIFENIGNATGTHVSKQNSTGWWVWANYTSSLGNSQTIVNATGTHESRWNSTSGSWWDWANYTGITTPLYHFENIVDAAGTHFHKQNSTGHWIWANYTGTAASVFSGGNLSVIDPNPGNGSHLTNFLRSNVSGLTCSVDVGSRNFTTPPAVLPGDYSMTIIGTAPLNTPVVWNTSTTGVYLDVHDDTTGQLTPGNPYVGQYLFGGEYTITRSFLVFNTSVLPAGAVINSGYIRLYVYDEVGVVDDFNVTVQECRRPVPHMPSLVAGDYWNHGFTNDMGHENTTGYVDDAVFNISLNAAGVDDVLNGDWKLTETVRWALVSDRDYVSVAPVNDEYIIFYGYGVDTGKWPRLILNYTVPSSNWAHFVNLTFYNYTSGLSFATSHVNSNSTVTVPAPVFDGVDVYYWNVSWESNHTNYGNSDVWGFETVITSVSSDGLLILQEKKWELLLLGFIFGSVSGSMFFMRRWKKNKNEQ